MIEYLAPVRERYERAARRRGRLEAILADGAERARAIAAQTLADVRERMGVGAPRGARAARWARGPSDAAIRWADERQPRPGRRRPVARPLRRSTSTSSAGRSTCCSRSCCAKRSTCSSSQLAEVVLAYLDHLEARGELDLETATEFIVLVAALLELKSRLLLSGEEEELLLDIEPREAAEELLARMLDARRYRAAAAHLQRPARRRARRALPHGAAARRSCAARSCAAPDGSQDPAVLGAAIGRLLRCRRAIDLRHIAVPRVIARRAPGAPARAAAPRAASASTRRSRRRPHDRRGDAVRAARALQTRRGRLGQQESFGEIAVRARTRATGRRAAAASAPRRAADRRLARRAGPLREASPAEPRRPTPELARTVEALLFLSTDPLSAGRAGRGHGRGRGGRRRGARAACRAVRPRRRGHRAARARRRLDARQRPRDRGRRAAPVQPRRASPRSRPPRPRRSRSSPTCSRSRARRSRASAASAPTRRPPRCSTAA